MRYVIEWLDAPAGYGHEQLWAYRQSVGDNIDRFNVFSRARVTRKKYRMPDEVAEFEVRDIGREFVHEVWFHAGTDVRAPGEEGILLRDDTIWRGKGLQLALGRGRLEGHKKLSKYCARYRLEAEQRMWRLA